MAGAVAQPLGVGHGARHGLPGGQTVFIDNIQHLRHGGHFLILYYHRYTTISLSPQTEFKNS